MVKTPLGVRKYFKIVLNFEIPSDMIFLLIPAGLTLLFFILIPGLGAFYTRSQWRGFRKNIIIASLTPLLTYPRLKRERDGFLGNYRFIGDLEAIQEDRIWLRNRKLAVSADLKNGSVYVLPSYSFPADEGRVELNRETLPDEMPKRISWNRIFSLPEGTKIFLGGPLYSEGGMGVFKTDKSTPLTVIIYDGTEETILRRAIWGGRQKNEYWNRFTPAALAAGALSLFIAGYIFLRSPYMLHPAALSFTCSLIPAMIFAPPGVLFYLLYRYLWRKSRFLRAERDVLQLPVRFFPNSRVREIRLPDGNLYSMKQVTDISTIIENPEYRDLKIRSSVLIEKVKRVEDGYSIFGVLDPTHPQDTPRKSSDPMVEYLLVPGDPEYLSWTCAKRARRFEILAVGAYVAGLAGNFLLVFLAFLFLLR